MGLAKQITENGFYRALFLVFQLLNTILISRLTGPSGFGLYSLMVVNANFLLMLTSLGIPSGILFHASVNDRSTRSLLRLAWIFTFLQVLLIMATEVLHYLFRGTFLIWQDRNIDAGVAGMLFFAAIVITEKYYALYHGYARFTRYNKVTAIVNILLFLALLFGLFLPTGIGVVTVMYIFISAQALQSLVLAFGFRDQARGSDPAKPADRYALLSYSIQSFLANMLFFLLTRLDFWILEYVHGKEQLGIYALAVRIVQLMLILPGLLSSITLPGIASQAMDVKTVHRIFRFLNTLNLAVVLILLLLSPRIIPFVFGEDFRQSSTLLMILLPGMLFLAAQTMLATYFAARRQVRMNVFSTALALVIAILLDLLLIPSMGASGAAIASSISYFIYFAHQYAGFLRQEGYPWYSLFLGANDAPWIRTLYHRLRHKYLPQ